MSRSDAFVTVTCDRCGEEARVQLTATARGGYDERHVDANLLRWGWVTETGEDVCEECVRKALEATRKTETKDEDDPPF